MKFDNCAGASILEMTLVYPTQETNMKRWLLALALLAAFSAQEAQAQVVGSYPWRTSPSPTVSPYLSLRSGVPAGIAYFNLVRPQIDAQKNFAMINQELLNAAGTATGTGAAPLQTGQEGGAAVFLNYGHYFPAMPNTAISPIGMRR